MSKLRRRRALLRLLAFCAVGWTFPRDLGAQSVAETPAGEYVCRDGQDARGANRGWFTLHSGGTYTDHWNEKVGSWKYNPSTREVYFSDQVSPGRAVYHQGGEAIVFADPRGGELWCRRVPPQRVRGEGGFRR